MRVIWWLLSVIAIGAISIFLSERQTLDPLRNFSLTITSPVEGGLRDIASPVHDLFDGVIDRGDLVRENRELKDAIAHQEVQIAEQQDAQRRVLELEAAVGVKQSRPEDQ